MKRGLSALAIVSLLAVSSILIYREALARLMLHPRIVPCYEGGPMWFCEADAQRICRTCRSEHGWCEDYWWVGNYCEHGIFYEVWIIQCTDGYYWNYDCSDIQACPK